MVNTFLAFVNYEQSALSLNLQRLRKQCVEAYQILNILEQLSHICELEGWPNCTKATKKEKELNYKTRVDIHASRIQWVTETRKRYLALPYRYISLDNKLEKRPKNEVPFKIHKTGAKYEVIEDKVKIWILRSTKKQPLNYISKTEEKFRIMYVMNHTDVALPQDNVYTLGFSQHAIVKMWAGYENSLKKYINAHVSIYCSMEKKNGESCSMDIPHFVVSSSTKPWWLENNAVINSHRASLLRKEKARNEPEHFVNIFKVNENYYGTGYIWTGSIDLKYVKGLMKYKNCYLTPDNILKISCPISADDKPKKKRS